MNGLAVVAADVVGTSVITDAIKTAIDQGLANLTATVNDVLGLTVVAALGIIAVSAGVNFAIKKVKGVINKAS